VDELHEAIAAGTMEQLVQRYMQVGALLIDDVQFLTGHKETQTELLRIFNALQADGRQLVITSDRPLAEIADVDERLITRLAGGLIVDIGAPDYETRMAILNATCQERGVKFRPGVIDEVGRIEFENVRELQGALNRLIAHQTLGGEMLTPETVVPVLGEIAEKRPIATARRVSGEFASFLTEIASAVAQHVEQWKTRLGEAIEYWNSEGYQTGMLTRVLQGAVAPKSLESLLREFEGAVTRLRDVEREVARLDAALAKHDAFHDPDRIEEAEQLLERA